MLSDEHELTIKTIISQKMTGLTNETVKGHEYHIGHKTQQPTVPES